MGQGNGQWWRVAILWMLLIQLTCTLLNKKLCGMADVPHTLCLWMQVCRCLWE
jgi:hypothetical protein